jgi:hypothetical protein
MQSNEKTNKISKQKNEWQKTEVITNVFCNLNTKINPSDKITNFRI